MAEAGKKKNSSSKAVLKVKYSEIQKKVRWLKFKQGTA